MLLSVTSMFRSVEPSSHCSKWFGYKLLKLFIIQWREARFTHQKNYSDMAPPGQFSLILTYLMRLAQEYGLYIKISANSDILLGILHCVHYVLTLPDVRYNSLPSKKIVFAHMHINISEYMYMHTPICASVCVCEI